ncbi:MAG TPA: hypothetical protein VGO80_19665 [Solirubrobacteraceae bacterium]|jgi:hypothetical protein|nr:hypothetical protein [Solirubrobacteraceae bacterium]
MSKREQQVVLMFVGAGLIVGGHKLLDSELGQLGQPHVVGAALVTLALRV